MNEYAKTTLMVYMMLEKAMEQLPPSAKPIQITEEELERKIMAWKQYQTYPHNVEIRTATDPSGYNKTMRAVLNKSKPSPSRNRWISLE